ncbi:HesB/YadR/YfhF family protein [Bacillus massiliglaciei]|uniref:HesB/YadR/YfhF family protein n=1 Tax=Bacillus massiliglaciei TaxID=1816693 RepID=UPI000B16B37E|nr:HesB/YadR/YfhF family protein [Bacillus massiliglaciei]
MELKVTDQAVEWYKNELDLQTGEALRIFVRYGGHSPIQSGFSLGLMAEDPAEPAVSFRHPDLTFFIEEDDLWYFDGHDLIIRYNEEREEPEFDYIQP